MEIKFFNTNLIPIYILLLFGLAYLTYLIYKRIEIIAPRNKKILTGMRIAVWVLIILALLNPVITFNLKIKQKSRFLFLIDSSASMSVNDSFNKSRISRAVKIINYLESRLKNKNYEVLYYQFDSEIKPAELNLNKIEAGGNLTDIATALSSVSTSAGDYISGVFLLSDGINNVYSDPLKEARILGKIGIPVFAFDFSKNESIKDISIFEVEHPEECLIDSSVPVKIKISQTGFNNKNIELKIYINDKFYTSKKLNLNKSFNDIDINLKFPKTGLNKVRAYIAPEENESITENNDWTFFVRVIKGRFKVLFIYGKACWEYKFLNYTFRLDPNIELDSYVKIKDDSLLGLKNISIAKYDLVIIGNIKVSDLPVEFINNLLNYVSLKSGAILFLGGENGFRNGGYHTSKLKDIIPVNWDKSGDILRNEFRLKLTGFGLSSEVMKISSEPDLQKVWSDLPACSMLNIIKEVSASAQVLAVSSINPQYIVLAVGHYKRSRVAIFAAYPTWKWAFLPVGVGKENDLFHSFWRQLVRFLVSADIEKNNISTDKLLYRPNEEIRVKASIENYNQNQISADLYIKKGENFEFLKNINIPKSSLASGFYETSFVQKNYGEYKISAKIRGEEISSYFIIEKPVKEFIRLNCDKDLLESICKVSGGYFINSEKELDNIFKRIKVSKRVLEVKRELSLWNSWIYLFLVVIFLVYEWYYRKKVGLL